MAAAAEGTRAWVPAEIPSAKDFTFTAASTNDRRRKVYFVKLNGKTIARIESVGRCAYLTKHLGADGEWIDGNTYRSPWLGTMKDCLADAVSLLHANAAYYAKVDDGNEDRYDAWWDAWHTYVDEMLGNDGWKFRVQKAAK